MVTWSLPLHLAEDLSCSFALELPYGVHLVLLLMKFIAAAGLLTILLLLIAILISGMVRLLKFWDHRVTVNGHRIGKELVKRLILTDLILDPASLAHDTLLGRNGREVVARLLVGLRTLLQCGLNVTAKLVL